MKNKKNVIMIIMCILMLVMATGYAYFATRLNINATGNITSNWNVYFSNITDGTAVGSATNASTPSVTSTTANMEVNLALPGDSMTYELTLTNGGTIGAIIEDISAEATGSSAIIYSISGIKIGDKLAGGASVVITIKIEYDSNATSQPSETSKNLTVTIDAVQDIGQSITTQTPNIDQSMYLSTKILNDNVAYADNVASTYVTATTGIDFSQPSSDTNGKGLYYTNKNTEDGKTTYYFRGNVENNYVDLGFEKNTTITGCIYNGELVYDIYPDGGKSEVISSDCGPVYLTDYGYSLYQVNGTGEYLGEVAEWKENVEIIEPILWRIVRINEDGSIKLVSPVLFNDVSFNTKTDYTTAYSWLNGYKYSESEVKIQLDNYYRDNLAVYSDIIADPGYCNDTSINTTSNTSYFAAYERMQNGNPQFLCSKSSDLYTTQQSTKGNKLLTVPIALLTADEVMYAGAYNSSSSYLGRNVGDGYWTMSPAEGGLEYSEQTKEYDAIMIMGGPAMHTTYPVSYGSEFDLLAVISLNSDVSILKGNGTSINPYVIKTN